MGLERADGTRALGMTAGVVVYACDTPRVAGFYARVAGLVEVQRDPGFVVLEHAAFQLVVVAVPPRLASRIVIADPPHRRSDTPIKPVFVVGDIEALRAAVTERGGQLDPQAAAWRFGDWHVLDGQDPEGNVFQLRAASP